MSIGERITELRKAASLSQGQLAAAQGAHPAGGQQMGE